MPGSDCRGDEQQAGRAGGGAREVPRGLGEVRGQVQLPGGREAGHVSLVLLLEGPRAPPRLAVPEHQPPVLLLLLPGQGA